MAYHFQKTPEELTAQAALECAEYSTSPCPDDSKKRPYWNAEASQFMYVPRFQFQPIPGAVTYRYDLKDEQGGTHSFTTKYPHSSFEWVWKDVPEGVVSLTVAAQMPDGAEIPAGLRTFYKKSPFTADLPKAVRGYRETAMRAYEFALSQSFMRHWLTHGTPDPDYDWYVYPSKMAYGIILVMIDYAGICPDKKDEALLIAVRCADYLLSITAKDGPMKGIPPTYQIDFRPDPETRNNLAAANRLNWCMMIYPAHVGAAYLALYDAVGDKKYLDAALTIGGFFRDTVEENGSWKLVRDIHTGEALAADDCEALREVVPLMRGLYEHTKDPVWKKLEEGGAAYAEKAIAAYDFGAQFEDSATSFAYSNLTHYGATALIRYYCQNFRDDEEKMRIADELMRFVEDQFVIWKRPSPWSRQHFDTSIWITPCGMEQYNWHVPIDASTSDISNTFLEMFKAGRGELHLAKAMALAGAVTRAQRENGTIPTHRMTQNHLNGDGFWINAIFIATDKLTRLADFLDGSN